MLGSFKWSWNQNCLFPKSEDHGGIAEHSQGHTDLNYILESSYQALWASGSSFSPRWWGLKNNGLLSFQVCLEWRRAQTDGGAYVLG